MGVDIGTHHATAHIEMQKRANATTLSIDQREKVSFNVSLPLSCYKVMIPNLLALLMLVATYYPATLQANEDILRVAAATSSVNATGDSGSTESSSSTQQYGPTKQGETLAQVAQQVSTDASITNEQMMWALYTANPKAFEKGKLNRLRAGVYLTVPSPEQARRIDAKIAHREIENRTAPPKPKPRVAKSSKTSELDAQIEEAKREREDIAKEQEFLKARLKEMEAKIQTLLRENAERDAKLRAQSAPPK